MLFSALAGGILTFYSLREAGQPGAARRALGASIGYVAVLAGLAGVMPLRRGGSAISVALGYAGGYVLNQLFLKKYLPEQELHPRKSWVKPLLIWVVGLVVGLGGLFLSLEGV